MGNFLGENKKSIEKRPNMESFLIVMGVCSFALMISFICKVAMKEEIKNTEIVIDVEKREYYEGNYDEAIEKLKKEGEKEKWPVKTIEESKIHSVKGDLLISNSFAEKAYIQSRVQLDIEGKDKYEEEMEVLSKEIAFTYLVNGDVEKAIEYGEFFLDDDNENNLLKETLVVAYLVNGDKIKAKNILDSIEVDRKNSYKLSEMGEMYILLKDYNEGIKYLKESYKLDKTNINVLNILREYKDERDFIKYIKENEKDTIDNIFITQIEIMNPETYDNGIKRMNNIEEGEFSRLILELQASERDLDEKRSEILINEIKESFEDTYGGTYVLSGIYTKRDDLENAIHYANKTLEINENFGKAYTLFSDILKKGTKDIDSAGTYIREGLLKSPYSVKIIKTAAEFYRDKGLNEISYIYYDMATKLDSYNYKNFVEKATIESKGEEEDLPIETIKNAIKVDSENSDLYNYLGIMYIEQGNLEYGIENIRKAYDVNNFNIKALNNVAVYYTNYEKNISRAMSNIKTAKENIKEKTDIKIKESVSINFSLIKKVYEEVEETSIQNWQIDNLEFLK